MTRPALRFVPSRERIMDGVLVPLAEVDLAEHVPGTPYKYKHGWIPVAAMPQSAISNYGVGGAVQNAAQAKSGRYFTKITPSMWQEKGPGASDATHSDADIFAMQTEHGGFTAFQKPKAEVKVVAKIDTSARDAALAPQGSYARIAAADMWQHTETEMILNPKASEQRVRSYTNSNWVYDTNGLLRRSGGSYTSPAVDQMDSTMGSFAHDSVIYRAVPPAAFGLKFDAAKPQDDLAKLRGLVGSTILDHGYMSTSYDPETPMVRSGALVLKILAPKGTKGLWAEQFSNYGPEREIVLARGQHIRVKSVEQVVAPSGLIQFVITGEIVSAAEVGQ